MMRASLHFPASELLTIQPNFATMILLAKRESAKGLLMCNNQQGWHHTSVGSSPRLSTFALADFFERFGRSLIDQILLHTEATAPENHYTKDFPQIAEKIKKKRG
jgi:hypothetical protein